MMNLKKLITIKLVSIIDNLNEEYEELIDTTLDKIMTTLEEDFKNFKKSIDNK